MTDRHDGGPAFPVAADEFTTGMTLRDWFAGQAMVNKICQPVGKDVYPDTYDDVAEDCYRLADAMLMARSEVKP